MDMDDISAVGAYGMPLRFNVAEGMMAITLAGSPYRFDNYQARTRSVYVNKNLIGMYRGVGMPLACVATELLTDLAAEKVGIDTVEFKRRNYWPKAFPALPHPGRTEARKRLVPRVPGEARPANGLRRAAQGTSPIARAGDVPRHRH